MRSILPAVLLLFLTLLTGTAKAHAFAPFQPSFDLLSISNPSPGAHADVVHRYAAPQGDHVIGSVKYTLPIGWDVIEVQSGTDEPVVGTGTLRIDVGPPVYPSCDGVQEVYPLTIVDTGPDTSPDALPNETEWAVQGYPFEQFIYVVKGSVSTGQFIEGLTFGPQGATVCSPVSFDLTFQGVSTDNPSTPENENGRNVLTNPGTQGAYTWQIQFKSAPVGDPQVQIVNRCDQAGIGGSAVTDTDADGIANSCDNCPTIPNNDQRDFDSDGLGDACDGDVDGDGILNASDRCASTPLGQSVDVNGCSQMQVDQDLDGVCDPGKSSPTLCTGSDNCPTASNSSQANIVHPATTAGDACEDPDADTWVDRDDNCPDIYNPFQQDGDFDGSGNECDPCPTNPDCDADNISDGRADPDGAGPIVAGPDNCPTWYNPAQNLPPWLIAANDPDCDGFSTTVENSAGTAPLIHCGTNAWPADINNDSFSDISDITALGGFFGKPVGPPPNAPARYNIAPDPVDGFVDISDIVRVSLFFGKRCS